MILVQHTLDNIIIYLCGNGYINKFELTLKNNILLYMWCWCLVFHIFFGIQLAIGKKMLSIYMLVDEENQYIFYFVHFIQHILCI